jgi:hypothetical protein
MSDFNAKPNWQARTLAGSFLREKVGEAVEAFDAVLITWQHEGQEGGFPYDERYSPLAELIKRLRKLRDIEELCFWTDSQEAHKAIDAFRRDLQEVPSNE